MRTVPVTLFIIIPLNKDKYVHFPISKKLNVIPCSALPIIGELTVEMVEFS